MPSWTSSWVPRRKPMPLLRLLLLHPLLSRPQLVRMLVGCALCLSFLDAHVHTHTLFRMWLVPA